MRDVFVDSSGFFAALDEKDPFHAEAIRLFKQAEAGRWTLFTTNYVVHETWALVQRRLGWIALDDFLSILLPACQIEYIGPRFHEAGVQRCRAERVRRLSLTDCVSFESMDRRGVREAIVNDVHFLSRGYTNPAREPPQV